jgi:hypothetical protein
MVRGNQVEEALRLTSTVAPDAIVGYSTKLEKYFKNMGTALA